MRIKTSYTKTLCLNKSTRKKVDKKFCWETSHIWNRIPTRTIRSVYSRPNCRNWKATSWKRKAMIPKKWSNSIRASTIKSWKMRSPRKLSRAAAGGWPEFPSTPRETWFPFSTNRPRAKTITTGDTNNRSKKEFVIREEWEANSRTRNLKLRRCVSNQLRSNNWKTKIPFKI